MPPPYRTPGVYVEEVEFRSRAISEVPTSTVAFVGRTRRGPVDRPTPVRSFVEFEDVFGRSAATSPMRHAVELFFANGGRDALICRVRNGWLPITDADIADPSLEAVRRGLWALDRVPRFDLLVIPPLGPGVDVGPDTWQAAAAYARRRRAMLLVDPPAAWQAPGDVDPDTLLDPGEDRANAALYYPRLVIPDASVPGGAVTVAPSGAVAGVWTRIAEQRGIWKSPAGVEAGLVGVTALAVHLTDAEAGPLNTRGINTLRSFPSRGPVVWGARTLLGEDRLASDWKYVPVRRTTLFIERSIEAGIQWAVFEPNGEPLWAELRNRVGAFLDGLFRQGAFQGQTAREAWFVRCDSGTTTQPDIADGIVTVLVGFAPLKPAEFVVLTIRQRTAPGSG